MMSNTVRIAVREDAKRQHRSLGMFCALYCWNKDKKAVFVYKELFLSFIGLERLKGERLRWLKEDISAYFPHVFIRKNGAVIVLSRIEESEWEKNKDQAIYLQPKIFGLNKHAGVTSQKLRDHGWDDEEAETIESIFPYINSVKNAYEFAIHSALSSLVSGLVEPKLALEDGNQARAQPSASNRY